ncbi:MAG: RecX family transcriptional regulator [Sphingobacteriales bacterium]|nr:MAG: RecX family transcriptional regulator [Sphingobacteriales bacterium]
MEIRTAIYKYCNYQERCHQDVRTKLFELGADREYGDELIAELIESNLLNEERFAQSYCRGKFSLKKWGRSKIRMHLKQKKVSDYCIRKGLAEINTEDYEKTLRSLCEKGLEKYSKEPQAWMRNAKITQYLMSRGYETDLIKETLLTLEPS